ncbi:MAG TPA: molybdopterin-dependent oxidoreductase [Vicinamibacterales bacterium]|nr:molybdopterin-dependent oxidoreductase [Vicinamibacterales bacterium]HOQ59952.1 molybdopterin-dependent oxidoreductase [Vicinamibacterales bacterium]HPK70970.1 molybdopterin-dependent oxidoreductase [Vicinamibacterales bacterium]
MDTVSLTIDGRGITVAKGTTILEAALENGISIPFFCYHPGIGIDGSCRVCLVRVAKMPKLQTACSTLCADGMVVETNSAEVVQARASVLEFLLINHPLDCPVCDKGGECPLQDFSYAFGPEASRLEFPRRTFDGEGAAADVDFGPTLLLNRNRCIMCTRCVRFMKIVDGDAQIGVVDRGGRSEIATFDERGVHSLLSGNLMDVCPVGAITTRDYRFASRPWDNPLAVDTTCTLCAKGCSTTVWLRAKPEWAKGARLIRITPRFNADVNGYWMCDIGRFGHRWVGSPERLAAPLVRQASGAMAVATWPDALARLRAAARPALEAAPGSFRLLVSAHASHEELFIVREITRRVPGLSASSVTVAWACSEKAQPKTTKFTVPAADAPNVAGAAAMGLATPGSPAGRCDTGALRAAIDAGSVRALYVFDPGPAGSMGDLGWVLDARKSGALPLLVVQGVLMTPLAAEADIVLPGSAWVEKEATYTNDRGLLQSTARALDPPGEAREDWRILADAAAALGARLDYADATAVRSAVAQEFQDVPALAAIGDAVFAPPVAIQTWLQASNPSERWKWDRLFQARPPLKGFPPVTRAQE